MELDIKGLFDNIKHGYLMYMVEKHTQIKWLILYIKRWLTVPFIMSDGSVAERRSGTPQVELSVLCLQIYFFTMYLMTL